jgi:hypothetical protein
MTQEEETMTESATALRPHHPRGTSNANDRGSAQDRRRRIDLDDALGPGDE